MKHFSNILALSLLAAGCFQLQGATPSLTDNGDFLDSARAEYDSFLSDARDDYSSFRNKLNNEYANFLADSNWIPAKPSDAVPRLSQRDRSIMPDKPDATAPGPLTIENVVTPAPPPAQPRPKLPFLFDGQEQELQPLEIKLWGTPFSVRVPRTDALKLNSVNPASVSKAWRQLSDSHPFDATLGDLLRLRQKHALCDWAFYCLVKEMANSLCGPQTPESALLTAYSMNQSGYATRLAFDSTSGKLLAMPGTQNLIFDQPYFQAADIKFYPFEKTASVQMISADYPDVRPLSMIVKNLPVLQHAATASKELTAKHYPEIKLTYSCNPNLMDFFDSYPASSIPGNSRTKWAYYALAPLSAQISKEIYPRLATAIEGKSQIEAANILMDICESIPYAPDNEVWGYDRAFFADETLNYLKGDCEDHAILFTRLVRDLMKLETALVYFPNHLAAAVCFTESAPGHYIEHKGKRWTLCDPTIFYAGVGEIMNGCNPSEASLILLPEAK